MKESQPFELDAHDLTGMASADLFKKEDLNALAIKLIANYNADRFDAMALRFFIQKNTPVVTIYAVDKFKQEQDNYPKDKLPVKKFKIKTSFQDFFNKIKRFDATITNDAYDVKDMLVVNK